jgi:hypothetical protein
MSEQKNKPTSLNTQTNPYMKLHSKLTLGFLALISATTLNAQTKVYITGSTAFRAAATTAIQNIFDSPPTFAFSNNSTSVGGANQAIFNGNIGGNPYQISTSWSGSEAGIQTVADAAQTVSFIADGTVGTPSPGTSIAAGTQAHHPDVAFSDTFQSTSQFNGTFNGVTYATLTESPGTSAGHGSPVGIVPFKWCANNGATITNITAQMARTLYSAGKVPLALFTGLNADETKPVVALGRNPDSGTRLTTFAETGIGALATVRQFQPQDSTGALVKTTSQTITKFINWPAETINGVPIAVFNSGYSSGGDLSKAMRAPISDPVSVQIGATTKTYSAATQPLTRIAYLGTGDADSNLLAGAGAGVELSYNGSFLGNVGGDYNTSTVLTEGKYTFWGFEHLLYNASTIAAAVQTAADKLATQIHDTDATVKLSNMRVTRSTDGANVTASYAAP